MLGGCLLIFRMIFPCMLFTCFRFHQVLCVTVQEHTSVEYVIVMKDDLEQTVNAMDQIYKVQAHIPAAKCMPLFFYI